MDDLLNELTRAWRENALAAPEPERPRRFGDVYFAPFGDFAGGAEHFGVVRGRKKGMGGTFRFSPVTSRRQTGRNQRQSLPMPKGTPLGRETRSRRLDKDSWLLLGLGPIPVPKERLREQVKTHHAHHVGLLPEAWIARMRAKLDGGGACGETP
jgi:hypothetical protein